MFEARSQTTENMVTKYLEEELQENLDIRFLLKVLIFYEGKTAEQ